MKEVVSGVYLLRGLNQKYPVYRNSVWVWNCSMPDMLAYQAIVGFNALATDLSFSYGRYKG